MLSVSFGEENKHLSFEVSGLYILIVVAGKLAALVKNLHLFVIWLTKVTDKVISDNSNKQTDKKAGESD